MGARVVGAVLLLLLLLLQQRLWWGDGGVRDMRRLERAVAEQRAENDRLKQRNQVLRAEVDALKRGLAGVEAHARSDLGMVREGETFVQLIGPAAAGAQ